MDSGGTMDNTFQDSGCISTSFDQSAEYQSTPLSHGSHLTCSRKRRHFETTLGSCPPTPQFSSTLNESIINHMRCINLETGNKLFDDNNFGGFSVPSTPEKQLNIVSPCKVVAASPLQESRKILYQDIKEVRPPKTPSPRKYKSVWRTYGPRCPKSLNDLMNIPCVMSVIFSYLSDNDLYRVGQVSTGFQQSLRADHGAYSRYLRALEQNRLNKENYSITPPGSPDKSPPRLGGEYFQSFYKLGRSLPHTKSLRKCPTCDRPSVVEHDVSQCTSCRFICCLRCFSFSSSGPENFVDSCGHSLLDIPLKEAGNLQPKKDDLTFLSDTSKQDASSVSYHDSGVSSEGESSPKVRRKLFEADRKVFACTNRMAVFDRRHTQKTTFARVIPNNTSLRDEDVDCPSPPKHTYAPCSKQSKRNLKRLTR